MISLVCSAASSVSSWSRCSLRPRFFPHRALALFALTGGTAGFGLGLGSTSFAFCASAAAASAASPAAAAAAVASSIRRPPSFSAAATAAFVGGVPPSSRAFATADTSSPSSFTAMPMVSSGDASALHRPSTVLSFDPVAAASPRKDSPETIVLVGRKSTLTELVSSSSSSDSGDASSNSSTLAGILGIGTGDSASVALALVEAALDSIAGKSGSASTFLPAVVGDGDGGTTALVRKVAVVAVPDAVSRNNHPLSVHSIAEALGNVVPDANDARIVLVGVGASSNGGVVTPGSLAAAVARAFPLYSRKTDDGKIKKTDDRTVRVTFLDEKFEPFEDETSMKAAEAAAEGVRFAARLVDCPPEELTTDAFASEARAVAAGLGPAVTFEEIVGEELKERGYGGLHAVGRVAVCPPRLVVLSYDPAKAEGEGAGATAGATAEEEDAEGSRTENIALVGKGIVYDTGGLSLKPKAGMCGMKHDMGGAAGLLGAFFAAVRCGTTHRLTLLLCLAENAIGPGAFRNDDVLTMYSGKTVEVNNCDAEGRLVLADGVAHATRHIEHLDLVVDMATLTGAQLVATGKKHAGVLANTLELERRAIDAGLASGDLVFPLLYAPELLRSEFKSEVADMKNSVKDRSNAQTSCAGHFIEDHLEKDYEGGWLHVDMAGPASSLSGGERGTGYGVGLVLSLLGVPGFV